MQNIVIDKPYRFVPPHHGRFWPWVLRWYLPRYLRKHHGVQSAEFLGLDRLKASLGAVTGSCWPTGSARRSDPRFLCRMLSAMATGSSPIGGLPHKGQTLQTPDAGRPMDLGAGLASLSFLGLLVTQFLVALNDNMFRWLVIPIGKQLLRVEGPFAWNRPRTLP